MSRPIHTWHVVSNEAGTVLAVYGSALLSEAQETARSIQAKHPACSTFLHSIKGDRPHVGQSISMKGVSL